MKKYKANPSRVEPLVVWSSYLFCIFQKGIHVILECLFVCLRIVVSNFFAIYNARTAKRHILIIVFVVLQPCLVDASQQEAWQVSLELVDSIFEPRVFFFKDMIDGRGIFR